MIVTSICILAILVLFSNGIYSLLEKDSILNNKTYIKVIVLFSLLSLILFLPIIDGVSIVKHIYSYFDAPSFFAMVLICASCLKNICYKGYNTNFTHYKQCLKSFNKINIRFNIYTALILFIYGAILYGGSLGIIDFYIQKFSLQNFIPHILIHNINAFDIYHTTLITQALISFVFLLLLYVSNKEIGILGLFALILFYIFSSENASILEAFICPYLWLYSAFYIICEIFKSCKLYITKYI